VGKGGTFVRGYGKITSPKTVEVNGDTYVARRGIVVATGTLAAVPPIPGLTDTPFWTNHEFVQVEQLPESLIVLGAGAIGTELGQVMNRFGVKVTIIEGAAHILPRNEPEVSEVLGEVFAAEGIEVHVGQFAKNR